MKKIFFTLTLLAGFTVAQAQIVSGEGDVQNEASAPVEATFDPEEAVEAAYDDLDDKLRDAHKSSSSPEFVFKQLREYAKELKKAILKSYELVEVAPVWEPNPELEQLKVTFNSKEEQYNKQMSDIEWFEEAEATFVKVVKDCLTAKRPSADQIRHAKAAATLLSDEHKDLKDRMSKY